MLEKLVEGYRTHQMRRRIRKLDGLRLLTEIPVGEYSYLVLEEVAHRKRLDKAPPGVL